MDPELTLKHAPSIDSNYIFFLFLFFFTGKRGHPLGSYRRSTTQVDQQAREGGISHPEALGLQILQTLPPGFEPGYQMGNALLVLQDVII